ncbi:adenine phosphoribosyltransferase-like [Liolophura sinensis]|uniref:adenine phosphoribosyltransferase-like n=1 Tax=Liolophura sinensis TaxID=3198878 RepID=UPI003159648A
MACNEAIRAAKLAKIRAAVQSYPDFPKPGVLFRDIFPIFQNPYVYEDLISVMEDHIKEQHLQVDVLVGLESRGFLFAPLLAYNLGKSFVPVRKKGKLPGEVVSIKYGLEYGEDTFEVQKHAIKPGQKVIIVDDLLATGGTMKAACELIENLKAEVLECITVIELLDLKGRERLNRPCTTILQF